MGQQGFAFTIRILRGSRYKGREAIRKAWKALVAMALRSMGESRFLFQDLRLVSGPKVVQLVLSLLLMQLL
jgi:ketosteroid isomerase-like protein